MNPTLIKNKVAEADVAAYRIVKHGSAGGVVQAADASAALVGISIELPAAAGARLDVAQGGIPSVEYGDTIAAGDPLTADADGKAVKAAPAAAQNAFIIGFAEVDGVAGDIGSVLFAPGSINGAGNAA